MFTTLFSGVAPEPKGKAKAKAKANPPAKTPASPKPKPKPKPKPRKKPTGPVPVEIERTHASGPFTATREPTPEPAPAKTLEYDDVSNDDDPPPDDAEWTVSESGSVNSDGEEGYDVSSMAMSDDVCGSLGSNPSPKFGLAGLGSSEGTRAIEKKRPPGIMVTFDDDSWID